MDARIGLPDIICHLIAHQKANFFARLLGGLPVQRTKKIPAMAVALQNRRYVLLVNNDWFVSASYDEVVTVIEHEAHHVILQHIPRQLRMGNTYIGSDREKHFDWVTPFAVDAACNSVLDKYTERVKKLLDSGIGLVFPGRGMLKDMPGDKAYEWYLAQLMDKAEEQESFLRKFVSLMLRVSIDQSDKSDDYKQGFKDGFEQGRQEREEEKEGDGEKKEEKQRDTDDADQSPDYQQGHSDGYQAAKGAGDAIDEMSEFGYQLLGNHQIWQEEFDKLTSDEKFSLADELEHHGKSVIRRALKSHKKNRGTLPGGLEELIDDTLKEPTIPWTKILRNRIINTRRFKWKRSIRRPKRRNLGIPELMKFPGRAKDRVFTVLLMIDTSGSMDTEDLQKAVAEIQSLQKVDKDIKIFIIEADVTIGREYSVGPYDEIEKSFTGRGGTDFNEAMRRGKELEVDIGFYFTDGYAPAPEKENHLACPFFWVITPAGYVPDENYGHVIMLDEY